MRSTARRPFAASAAVALLAGLLLFRLAEADTPIPAITLPPLTETERGWVADPDTIPVHARLGFGRAVPEGALAAILDEPANWRPISDGGHRLAVRVTSPGAAGLRLGLRVDALPDGATLAVAGAAGAALAPAVLSGAEIKASLARDAAAQRNEEARDDARPRR